MSNNVAAMASITAILRQWLPSGSKVYVSTKRDYTNTGGKLYGVYCVAEGELKCIDSPIAQLLGLMVKEDRSSGQGVYVRGWSQDYLVMMLSLVLHGDHYKLERRSI